jgi:hypothetical protein
MRLAFWTAAAGVTMVYLGLVLAAMLVFGFLPALAGGLVVGGASLIVTAETILAPKRQPTRGQR